MRDEDYIIEIKTNITKDIIEQKKSFYVDVCILLECALKELQEYYNVFETDDTLILMSRKVADEINFADKNIIEEIIKHRNRVIHEAGRMVQADRYHFVEYCRSYNNFIIKITELFTKLSCIYLIDPSVFDISVAILNQEQGRNDFDENAAILEKQIKEQEDKVNKLYEDKKTNTTEFIRQKDFLFSGYKSLLPWYIYPKNQITYKSDYVFNYDFEFEYDIGCKESDNGFFIRGIKKDKVCKSEYASMFSVIHGILTKSKIYKPSLFINKFAEETGEDYICRYILMYQLIILSLIKNNLYNGELAVNIEDGTEKEFEIAIKDIQNYLDILCTLRKIQCPALKYKFDKGGYNISLNDPSADIYIEESDIHSNTIFCWSEPRKLTYKLDEGDKPYLNELADDLFGIKKLKDGQLNSIIRILNDRKNYLCLFPTGYGKSLIFYMLSYLSSGFTLIVSPTQALIDDQLRNLSVRHNISNVYVMDKDSEYFPKSKLVYISSDMFVNKNFLESMSMYSGNHLLNSLILDEVHCLSIWGHDFRSDYIMLLRYLDVYFSEVRVVGLTATANAKVLYELQKDLNVEKSDVIESDSLKRNDITVNVETVNNIDGVYDISSQIISHSNDSDRWLVYVKNKKDNDELINKLPFDLKGNVDSYFDEKKNTISDFVNGITNILITRKELGIGINYPDVNMCMHVGYPVSINQFVQEVGRIAREDNINGTAYVVAQSLDNLSETDQNLIDINTSIEEIIAIVGQQNEMRSDIVDLFDSIFDYLDKPSQAIVNINNVYDSLCQLSVQCGKLFFCPLKDKKEKRKIQFYLVLLTKIGILSKWFFVEEEKNIATYYIEKNDCWNKLNIIKDSAIADIRSMMNHTKTVIKIKQAETVKDVILYYVNWYYDQFLTNKREQLVNLLQAVDEQDLSEYFQINFAELDKMKEQMEIYSPEDLLIFRQEYINKKSVAMVIKLSEIEPDGKCDLFLLWNKGRKNASSDFKNRLKRVISYYGNDFINNNLCLFKDLYLNCSEENKDILITQIYQLAGCKNIVFEFYKNFNESELDENYYKYLALLINNTLEEKNG